MKKIVCFHVFFSLLLNAIMKKYENRTTFAKVTAKIAVAFLAEKRLFLLFCWLLFISCTSQCFVGKMLFIILSAQTKDQNGWLTKSVNFGCMIESYRPYANRNNSLLENARKNFGCKNISSAFYKNNDETL